MSLPQTPQEEILRLAYNSKDFLLHQHFFLQLFRQLLVQAGHQIFQVSDIQHQQHQHLFILIPCHYMARFLLLICCLPPSSFVPSANVRVPNSTTPASSIAGDPVETPQLQLIRQLQEQQQIQQRQQQRDEEEDELSTKTPQEQLALLRMQQNHDEQNLAQVYSHPFCLASLPTFLSFCTDFFPLCLCPLQVSQHLLQVQQLQALHQLQVCHSLNVSSCITLPSFCPSSQFCFVSLFSNNNSSKCFIYKSIKSVRNYAKVSDCTTTLTGQTEQS